MIENLIVIEHDGQRVKPSSLGAIALARQLGGTGAILVLGSGIAALAESVRGYGAEVLTADHPSLAEPLADRYASVIVAAANQIGAVTVLGTSSTFTKDILPRVAALLDAPMLSDVTAVEMRDGQAVFSRPVNAGSSVATVRLSPGVRVLTARGTAFHAPIAESPAQPVDVVAFDAAALPAGTRFVSRAVSASSRPELTEARVVVSGGRPLNDGATFERLIGGLADALGGAVGATRAAVDAGMAPNDWQVGQTGKGVAPELYIAVGVSGAVQHMAGIKDSRVIVAINRDPDAPVFQMANYGLVGDLFKIVPDLIAAVRKP